MRRTGVLALLLVAALLAAAPAAAAWSWPGAADDVDKAEVVEVYQDRCSACHGAVEAATWSVDLLEANANHVKGNLSMEEREQLRELQREMARQGEAALNGSSNASARQGGGAAPFAAESRGGVVNRAAQVPSQAVRGMERAMRGAADAARGILEGLL